MTQLTVSTTINTPLTLVYEALWNPVHIMHWCHAGPDWHCPKAIGGEPKVGETFTTTYAAKDGSFAFDLVGRYDIVEPQNRLLYTIGEMKEFFLPAGREVEVLFETTPEWVRVTEIFDAEDVHSHEMQIAGWGAILENLRKYCETL